jgi:YbbR domain-containing protein
MKKILASFGITIFSFLLALILATAVWVNAVATQDPDETRTLSVPLAVTVQGLKEGLVAQGYQNIGAQVTLRAPRSVWDRLSPNTVQVLADLTGKTEGKYSIPLKVATQLTPVRVEKLDPASVQILIDHLATRSLAVHVELTGSLALGFQAGTPIPDPATVSLSGPQTLIDSVTEVVAAVNVEGLRSSTDQNIPLLALDTQGNNVAGVSITPLSISVSIPVQQLGGYRDLVVKVPLTGTVKSGYRLTGLTITPQVVTLYSDNPDVIQNLPGYVETQPLDISEASADLSESLALVLPAGVQVVGDPKILVQVSIAAIEDSITLSRPIRFVGLTPGLTAILSPSSVDIIISGPAPIIWSLRPADVDVFLDLTGLAPGTYKLKPEVKLLDSSLQVVTISPEQVEVVIKPEPTPSPTPKKK